MCTEPESDACATAVSRRYIVAAGAAALLSPAVQTAAASMLVRGREDSGVLHARQQARWEFTTRTAVELGS
jgi:hypothetical protein